VSKAPSSRSVRKYGELKQDCKGHRTGSQLDKLKNHIEMTITPEGLRIELMESQKDTFF